MIEQSTFFRRLFLKEDQRVDYQVYLLLENSQTLSAPSCCHVIRAKSGHGFIGEIFTLVTHHRAEQAVRSSSPIDGVREPGFRGKILDRPCGRGLLRRGAQYCSGAAQRGLPTS